APNANVAQASSLWGSRASCLAFNMVRQGETPAGRTASPQDESVRVADKMAVLQQRHLRALRRRFGEANANADETHRFSSAGKCFGEQRAEILQGGRESSALGRCPGKIVELQFYKNLRDRSSRLLLRKVGHYVLE